MPKSLSSKVSKGIGGADPVISMAQRVYDLVSSQWPAIIAFFATGGGVTFLAFITDWARSLGPLGIGLIIIGMSFVALISVSASQSFSSKKRLRIAQAHSVERWNKEVSSINPLLPEFHTKRINIGELTSPIDSKVNRKRIIDCELMGPQVITFMVSATISGCSFNNCDFVVPKDSAQINNVVVFENCTIIGCAFWRCTIYVPKIILDMLSKEMGQPVAVISLVGDPRYGNQKSNK